ncbi:DUF5681 domain-containing protein [Parasphingorhabdus sp.]|uniref:DUF5681 domain-containing protein n=1 Tax=Parasphingorhabdus sp. TaxID=2709688 RepID=UPI002B275324|nr:DUF5681 domain-containing protein [Parasphingorhabdus sp.]|tara:strand:+ start:2330 stop:3145 length:816 start_codon:yes stop_codon:yes gene_type:complete
MQEDNGQKAGQTNSPSNLPAKYEVGYAKPPALHQFQKGKSGNPRGRPKGSRNKKKPGTDFGNRPAEELLRQEAYRPVTVREGDRVVEPPAIQAVFRSMGVSAMKGNRFVQRTLAEMVRGIEAEDRQLKIDNLEHFVKYKNSWDEEIARCRKAGIPEPEPVPHPDDVIINPDTGDVRVNGPKTKEQKQLFDKALETRRQCQEDVSYFAAKYKHARDPKRKAFWLEEWHYEQKIFDTINDLIGKRHHIQLQDRSYAEGATRSGDIAKKRGLIK